MVWYLYVLAIGAGFACGYINTLAGSGSLITLPLLIFLGLPANIANGTNRIAILLQNAVASRSFHTQRVLDLRGGLMLSIPAVVGSLIGAQIAVNLDALTMQRAIAGLMIFMVIVMAVRPQRWLQGRPDAMGHGPSWKQALVFFAIGIYGGFIQAGVGIFLLAGLVLDAGYDLVRANAVKVLITLCLTATALIVFVLNGEVEWGIGLIVGVGTMLGAWVAARMAVKRGAIFIHRLLIVVVVLSAVQLLGGFDLLARWLA
jgi:uncharacterized membrane protein YfcA